MYLPSPESFSQPDTVETACELTAIEERVVLLAKRDADRGEIEPRASFLSRFVKFLTGVEGPQPLADDRLETLRRFVAFERRGDRRAADVLADLIRFGFSPLALSGASAMARA